MAGLIRSLFKGKKNKKENKDETGNPEDYLVFQPCPQRTSSFKQQTRFADDHMLPATAAYHTQSAPKLRKGPQSCPGGRDFLPRKVSRHHREDFRIDDDEDVGDRRRRQGSLRHSKKVFASDDEGDSEDEKSYYYMKKFEISERQRREERAKQEKLEKERNNIQNAMANMAYCMANVQQMELLKKERDQYKKEMSRYKNKCEKLENRVEKMETTMSIGGIQPFTTIQPSPYHTPQYPPPAPLSFQYPNPMMTSLSSTTSSSHQNAIQNLQNMPPPPLNFMNNTGPPPPLSSNFHRSADFLNLKPPTNFSGSFGAGGGDGGLSNLLNKNQHGGSTSFTMSNTPTTIGSDGAGEALVNPAELSYLGDFQFKAPSGYHDSDEDEVKNYRYDDMYSAPSSMSNMTQSTSKTQ